MLFFLVNGHNDNSVGIAEQDFTSHTYQEIGQFAYTFNIRQCACVHDMIIVQAEPNTDRARTLFMLIAAKLYHMITSTHLNFIQELRIKR